MQPVEILIKTKADLAGAKAAEAQLEKDITKARALGAETAKLTELEQKLARVRSSIAAAPQGLGSGNAGLLQGLKDKAASLPGVGGAIGALSSATAGIFAAVGVAAAGAAKGLTEFAAAQTRVAGLDAALAQTGQLTDAYRERLQDLAAQLQVTTGVADDEWIGVLQRLTQFGSTAETIERDTEAVKNLAGILGGDLASASNLIARANQGSYQSFSRLGIKIDENATQSEKLSRLYEELAQRGGGQLEARSRTLTGQFSQLKNATSDFFEAIGRGIASTGVLQATLTGLTDAMAYWAEVLGGLVPKVEGLENANKKTTQSMEDGAEAAARQAAGLEKIKKQAGDAADEVKRLTGEIDKTKSDEDRIADAKKARELARIDALEKSGRINPVAAADARASVEVRYAQQSQAREEKRLLDQAALQKRTRINAEKEINTAEEKLRDERAKAATQTDREAVDQQISVQEKRLEDARKEFKAAAEQRNKLGSGGQGSAAVDALDAQLNSSGGVIRDSAGTLAKLRRRRRGFAEGDANVSAAEAELRAKLEANIPVIGGATETYGDLQRQIRTGRTVFGIESQTQGIRNQTTAGGAADKIVQDAIGQARQSAQKAGGSLDDVSQETERMLRDFVNGLKTKDTDSEKAIEGRVVQKLIKIMNERRAIGPG